MKYLPLLLVFMVDCVLAVPLVGIELHPCSKTTCKATEVSVSGGAKSIVVNAIIGVHGFPPCENACSMVGLVDGDQFLAVGSVLDITCKFWPSTPQCCLKRHGEGND